MVAFDATVSLAALSDSTAQTMRKSLEMNKPHFSGDTIRWAGTQESSMLQPGRSFFLDIPFYRTH